MPQHVGTYVPAKEDIESYIDRLKAALELNEYGEVQNDSDDAPDSMAAELGGDATNAEKRAHDQLRANDRKQKSYLISEMGSEAYKTLARLVLPDRPMDKTMKVILKVLRNNFNSTHSTEAAKAIFMTRIQKKNETVNDYIQEIQGIASKCNYGDTLKNRLLERLRTGARNDAVLDKLHDNPTITYDEACKVAIYTESQERTKNEVKKMRAALEEKEEKEEKEQKKSTAETESDNVVNKVNKNQNPNKQRGGFRGRGRGRGGYEAQSQNYQNKNFNYNKFNNPGNFNPNFNNNFQFNRGQGQQFRGRGNFRGRGGNQGRGNHQNNYSGSGNNSGNKMKCERCNKEDHLTQDCGAQNQVCYKCNGTGHYARACPNVRNVTEELPQYLYQEDFPSYQENVSRCNKIEERREKDSQEDLKTEDSPLKLKRKWCNFTDKTLIVDDDGNEYTEEDYQKTKENLDEEQKTEDLKEEEKTENEAVKKIFPRENTNDTVKNIEVKPGSEGDIVYITLSVGKQRVTFEMDSGSKYTLISEETFYQLEPKVKLNNEPAELQALGGFNLERLGQCTVDVTDKFNQVRKMKIVVLRTKKKFLPLLGREWLDELVPGWRQSLTQIVNTVGTSQDPREENIRRQEVNKLKEEFPKVFSKDRSQAITHYHARIIIKPDAVPVRMKEYEVPFALKEKMVKQLNNDVKCGLAKLIHHPEWASPVWPIEKSNGDVRVVVDFKRTINPQLKIDQYKIPKPEELFVKCTGKYYSKLDNSEMYLQMKVHPDDLKYNVANTAIGFLQYERILYGIASAPAKCQELMDIILKPYAEWAFAYLDDTVVTGKTLEECIQRTRLVIKAYDERNVRVNFDKCDWFKQEIQLLGFSISQKGRKTVEKSIEAISQCPEPKNVSQLSSYLGMFNFYKTFVPNVCEELAPLYRLLCDDQEWEWTEECKESFDNSKLLLKKHKILTHFNPDHKLIVQTDASPVGVSGVLAHRIGKKELPVMFASATLTPTQAKYSQLEREALAVISAIKKFHKYLYGRKFTLVIDNQPLKYILGPDKPLPVIAAKRVQVWALLLSAYQYEVEYRRTAEMGPADALSRLPLKNTIVEEVHFCDVLEEGPLNFEVVAAITKEDPTLQQVILKIQNGWPEKCPLSALMPFFKIREALSTQDDCVMWGHRVIIPHKLRPRVMKYVHAGHPGIVRAKMLCRQTIWWPGLDSEIEKITKNCEACSAVNFKAASNITIPWQDPEEFWIRVHIDFCKHRQVDYLILEDAHTKWAHVWRMTKMDASNVILKLSEVCANFGPPEMVVSDNGPPFNSVEFINWCTINMIVAKRVSKYHPQSNGLAERFVGTAKRVFEKYLMHNEDPDVTSVDLKIQKFLYRYRNTPSTVTGLTPAQMVLQKKPRTMLQELRPPLTQKNYKSIPDRACFQPGERVKVKYFPGMTPKNGIIVKKLGPTVYMVSVDGEPPCSLHINQLQLRTIEKEPEQDQERKAINKPVLPPANVPEKNTPRQENVHTRTEEKPATTSETSPNDGQRQTTEEPLTAEPQTNGNNSNSTPEGCRRGGRNRMMPKMYQDFQVNIPKKT
ncbi:hypothetical protein FOCC_FOCC014192 [Frankliniella occidentalis]|nr:hypothetical protein FOCC_FOCC014192 [Frankliniella occidentalis]